MMGPGGDEFNDELTDDELDAIISAAHGELLAHAHAHASPSEALVTIMAHDDRGVSPITSLPGSTATQLAMQRLEAVVAMRRRVSEVHAELDRVIVRARELAIDLDQAFNGPRDLIIAFKAARAITRQHDRQLANVLGHAQNLAIQVTHDLTRVRRLDRELTMDRDLAILRELAMDIDVDQTFDGIRQLDRVLAENRELSIDREISAARELSIALDRARRFSLSRERAHDINRSRARAIALAIDLALDCARSLAEGVRQRLNTFEVDASGADLSRIRVVDLSALAGVIWSDDTVWPSGVAEHVHRLSRELTSGVYQVRGGGQRYAPELALA